MGWLWHALAIAGSMTWEVLWALILGFALSAVVQAVVRREAIVRLLGDDRPRTIAVGLGAASSSCSYAAVALARALFRKGAISPPRWRSRSPPLTSSSNSASFLPY